MTPAWIPPRKDETLAEYASRFAETIPTARPMVLGGVSFGGMVAHEMAKSLEPDAVVLIASCRTHRGMRSVYWMLYPLLSSLPTGLINAAKLFAPAALAALTRLSPDQRKLCTAMFNEANPQFLRWALRALLDWNPKPLEGILVRQIHGRRDRIIPARRVYADEIIPGGGHLINLTHAEQVNEFIRKVVAMVAS